MAPNVKAPETVPAYSILWPANTKCHIKSSTRTTTSLVPTRFFHRHTHIHTRSQHTRSVIQATKIKRLKEKNGQCVVALKTWKGKKKKKKMCWLPEPPIRENSTLPPRNRKARAHPPSHDSDHPRPLHKLLQSVCASQRVARVPPGLASGLRASPATLPVFPASGLVCIVS